MGSLDCGIPRFGCEVHPPDLRKEATLEWKNQAITGVRFNYLPPRNRPNNPIIAAAIPPTSSKTVLSVGEPVNARDTSELNDSEALIPQPIKTMPTTNNATEILLFIINTPES